MPLKKVAKEELLASLLEKADDARMQHLYNFIKDKDVDIDWTLSMLRHFKPNHSFFSVGYVRFTYKKEQNMQTIN